MAMVLSVTSSGTNPAVMDGLGSGVRTLLNLGPIRPMVSMWNKKAAIPAVESKPLYTVSVMVVEETCFGTHRTMNATGPNVEKGSPRSIATTKFAGY
jgi:hypothetical protein